MKEMILQTMFDFSKDEDGNLQNINKNALGFLAEEIYKNIKSAMCEANLNAVLGEVIAEFMIKADEYIESHNEENVKRVLEEILGNYFA